MKSILVFSFILPAASAIPVTGDNSSSQLAERAFAGYEYDRRTTAPSITVTLDKGVPSQTKANKVDVRGYVESIMAQIMRGQLYHDAGLEKCSVTVSKQGLLKALSHEVSCNWHCSAGKGKTRTETGKFKYDIS